MGKQCCQCGKNINIFTGRKYDGNMYCISCYNDLMIKITLEKKESFQKTNQVGSYIWVDDVHKKWLIPEGFLISDIKSSTKIYDYSDILNFELLSNNTVVSSGGVGRALVGGVLFGGAGAIIGGLSGRKTRTKADLKIKITLNDISQPPIYIKLINYPMDVDGFTFRTQSKNAQEILSMLDVMTQNRN